MNSAPSCSESCSELIRPTQAMFFLSVASTPGVRMEAARGKRAVENEKRERYLRWGHEQCGHFTNWSWPYNFCGHFNKHYSFLKYAPMMRYKGCENKNCKPCHYSENLPGDE